MSWDRKMEWLTLEDNNQSRVICRSIYDIQEYMMCCDEGVEYDGYILHYKSGLMDNDDCLNLIQCIHQYGDLFKPKK